ncbi:MAG: hypothetical protein Q4C43_04645 [Prevotella sp.]|nr:hypothetical protein [Prevotella sp.]
MNNQRARNYEENLIDDYHYLCYANTVLAQGRIKVILDNDFAGDPDGLFALAQLVESPSVDIRAIIGSHLHQGEN